MRYKCISTVFTFIGLFLACMQIAFADVAPPSVTVLSPNGGEVWKVGETRRVMVSASAAISTFIMLTRIELYFSQDNGLTWELIEVIDQGPYAPLDAVLHYSFDWRIPDKQSTQCLIRADAYDAAGNRGTDMSNRIFTIARVSDTTSPTVRLLSPNGGESWKTLETRTIYWEASDPLNAWETSDSPDRIKINILYTHEGLVGWGYLRRDLQNTGSYRWTIPHWTEKSYPIRNWTMKIEAVDDAGNTGTDTSDGTFTIAAGDLTPPTVSVVTPNGGEVWKVGERRTINWNASDNVGVAKVDITLKGEKIGYGWEYVRIATGITHTGSYSIVVPDFPARHCTIEIVAWDAAGNNASDRSDGEFTIETPPPDRTRPWLQIISPASETVVKGGTGGFDVRVRATDDVGIRDFTIKIDDVVRDTVTALPGKDITQTLHPRVYGIDRHIIQIIATDQSGKDDTEILTVYADDAPPTIADIQPQPNAPAGVYETASSSIGISANIIDRGRAGIKEARLVHISGPIIDTQTRPYEGNRYLFQVTGLRENSIYQYYIQVFDKVDNMSQTGLITIRRAAAKPEIKKPPVIPKLPTKPPVR